MTRIEGNDKRGKRSTGAATNRYNGKPVALGAWACAAQAHGWLGGKMARNAKCDVISDKLSASAACSRWGARACSAHIFSFFVGWGGLW